MTSKKYDKFWTNDNSYYSRYIFSSFFLSIFFGLELQAKVAILP